jgi:two-component system response regulator YesN
MFQVLIVDDEEPVREAIRILGDWDKFEVNEIYEAGDGKTGLQILREEKPDIVLVDMRMPELNGIEFLQKAAVECPNTLNIVISGYDDFEFTRQAIQSRAVDYLLKPINQTELNSALRKAVDDLKQRKSEENALKDIHSKLELSLPSLKEKVFLSLLEDSGSLVLDDASLQIIGYHERALLGVAILRITNLAKITRLNYHNDVGLLITSLITTINQYTNDEQQLFSFRNPHNEREIIIFIVGTGLCAQFGQLTFSQLQIILQDLENRYGVNGVAGISEFQSDWYKMADSYRFAESMINNHNLLNMEDRVWYQQPQQFSKENQSILTQRALIHTAIENGSLGYLQTIINQYLKKIKDAAFFSLRDAARALDELIIMMDDIALEYGAPIDNARNYRNHLRVGQVELDYLTFEDFSALLICLMEHFYNQINSYIKSGKDFNVYEIKDYIDRNYHEEIKISFFSDKYYLSRVYLMKLFKREFGFGIYEYVLKVRMNRAKELLGDPSIKILNISQMLGYNDHNYFSKAFKNYFGIAPTDYRSMILKQAEKGNFVYHESGK